MPKVCLVCSCGGHLMEMMQVVPWLEGTDYYVVTERHEAFREVLKGKCHHLLWQQDRKTGAMGWLRIAANSLLSFLFLLRERPTTIISTGAGAAIPTCLLGKLMGARLIFIESFAKVEGRSVTGRVMHRFADYFFVQWDSDLEVYPNARYEGSLY